METRFAIVSITLFVSIAFLPFVTQPAYAAGDTSVSSGSGGGITNPLSGGSGQTITSVLKAIIQWMLGLVGFLALIALIIGGGRMVIDFGNEDQVHKAKTTILWAVIGLAVVILSYAILNIVTSEVLKTGGGNSYDSSGSITPDQLPPPGA